MIELDVRAVVVAVVVFAVTVAGPATVGGAVLAIGVIAAAFAVRSVFRGNESDVTVAVAVGGAAIAVSLFAGIGAACAVAASVFAGSEVAAMGRWIQLDRDIPIGRELRRTVGSIALGLGGGAAVLGVAQLPTAPAVANAALVLLVIGVGVAAVIMRRRTPRPMSDHSSQP